jgi:hypothetical protein
MDEAEEREPHDEIVRLETRIEQLEARIESCRKFIVIARVAAGLGLALLVALMFGAIRFDPLAMTASIAAVLCGIVLGGSNSSTEKEARVSSRPPRRSARRSLARCGSASSAIARTQRKPSINNSAAEPTAWPQRASERLTANDHEQRTERTGHHQSGNNECGGDPGNG